MVTKHQLITALLSGGPLKISEATSLLIVNAVEREDGSGRSFNVTGVTASGACTVHVRTID